MILKTITDVGKYSKHLEWILVVKRYVSDFHFWGYDKLIKENTCNQKTLILKFEFQFFKTIKLQALKGPNNSQI